MESPLTLFQARQYKELLLLLHDEGLREKFLLQINEHLSARSRSDEGVESKQRNVRTSRDWTWGLLTDDERQSFLRRDVDFLQGAGNPDKGKAQLGALKRLKRELTHIYQTLDRSLAAGELEWLEPIARTLWPLLEIQSQFAAAHERYALLLRGAKELNDPDLELAALVALGGAEFRRGSFDSAMSRVLEARSLARRVGATRMEAAALNGLGILEGAAGHNDLAREALQSSYELYCALGLESGRASVLLNLGQVEEQQGNYSTARAAYEQAGAIWQKLGDLWRHSGIQNNLGLIELHQGNYPTALNLFSQALSTRRKIGDRLGEAVSLGNLGLTEIQLGNYARAIELGLRALEIRREVGDRRAEANSLNDLGLAHKNLGNAELAAQFFEESLGLRREIGDRRGVAISLGNLGDLAFNNGDLEGAASFFLESLTIFCELGDKKNLLNSTLSVAQLGESLKLEETAQLVGLALKFRGQWGIDLGKSTESRLRDLAIAHSSALEQDAIEGASEMQVDMLASRASGLLQQCIYKLS